MIFDSYFVFRNSRSKTRMPTWQTVPLVSADKNDVNGREIHPKNLEIYIILFGPDYTETRN